MTTYKFVQAGDFHAGRLKPLRVVVVHTPEGDEYPEAAEDLAAWMAGHVGVSYAQVSDADSTVETVKPWDTGFHAYNFNSGSYGAAISGRAGQGAAGWGDPFSRAALRRCARAVVDLVPEVRLGLIPVRRLTVAQLQAGEAGFAGHVDVADAFGYAGQRTDPGAAFPWADFLAEVRAALAELGEPPTPTPVPPPPSEEDPVIVPLYPPTVKAHHYTNETGYQLGYEADEEGTPKRHPEGFRHVYVNATALAGDGALRLRVKAKDGAEKATEKVTVPLLGSKTWDLAELVIDGRRVWPDPGALVEVSAEDGSPCLLSVTGGTVK